MSNAKLGEVLLEETIRKILQSELKLIFSTYFSFSRDSAEGIFSSLIAPKQIVPIQEKIVFQSNIPSASKDLTLDEFSQEKKFLNDLMEYISFRKRS